MKTFHYALFAALLAVGCGSKKDAQPAAPAQPAQPAQPEVTPQPEPEPKPEPKPEPQPEPKPPEKSAVEKATEALKTDNAKEAAAALGELRKYVDTHPEASDFIASGKFLAFSAIEGAVKAIEAGDQHTAGKFIEPLMDGKGKLSDAVGRTLGVEREDLAALAEYLGGGRLEDIEKAVNIGKSQSKVAEAAKRVVTAKLAPIAKAFSEPDARKRAAAVIGAYAGGDWVKCPAVRGTDKDPAAECEPAWFGARDKQELEALRGPGLQIMRLAVLARFAGDAAPKGSLELPLPENPALELPATRDAATQRLPLEVVTVTAAGVHTTVRPVAELGTDGLAAGGAWPGAVAMTAETIGAVEKDEDLTPLVDAFKKLREQATAAEKAAWGEGAGAPKETGWAASLIVEKGVDAKTMKTVLKAMALAGYTDPRYLRGKTPDGVLAAPQVVDTIPEARRGRKEGRALLVHLTKTGAHVWPASKGEGEATKEETAVAFPGTAKRWYKGTRVAKYEVRGDEVAALVQTVRALRQQDASGTVVLVSAADDVPAERTLGVANALAGAEGTPLDKIGEVFPGLACKDENSELASAGCRSLFPVVLPEVEVPSSRGLTEEPTKKEVKKPEPKPEKPVAEKPVAENCDYSYIRGVVKSRKGTYKFCYDRQLQMNNDLKGKATFKLDIAGNGTVLNVSSSGSMPDAKVTDCVIKAMQKLKFKPMIGGTTCHIKHRITFQP